MTYDTPYVFQGNKLTFTPWGIVSGIMLVPGGICGAYAVKNAGLAVSQGIWSSLKVLVSFIWGMFIFDEMVKSRLGAYCAVLFISLGLVGMSIFSSPSMQRKHVCEDHCDSGDDSSSETTPSVVDFESESQSLLQQKNAPCENNLETVWITDLSSNFCIGLETPLIERTNNWNYGEMHYPEYGVLLELKLSRRQLGLLCAIFNGVWGGSFLVPLHYSK